MISTRYPELNRIYAERLLPALCHDEGARLSFWAKVHAYFSGELPHCKDVITSTLLNLLDIPTPEVCNEPAGDHGTISRVSQPWPNGTQEALRVSLGNGVFDDLKFSISCGPKATVHLVHFPLALVSDRAHVERSSARASGFSLFASVTDLHIHPLSFHTD